MHVVTPRARKWLALAVGASAAVLAACWSSNGDRSDADGGSSNPRDAAYGARLAKFRHDSTVLDSLTRLVNTDSLYRIYRRALDPGGVTQQLSQAMLCEETRLMARHGVFPSRRAVHKMLDTVYADKGIVDGFGYFSSRAPNEGSVNTAACVRSTEVAPMAIDGTRLDVEPERPKPPR